MSLSVLTEWLGQGGVPVDRRIAEHRAEICRQCPENSHPKWWQISTQAAAEVIRIHLEIKNSLNISVEDESQLHMCRVCGCCLPLKIHTPLDIILSKTAPEMLARFPENCWIPTEDKSRR